MCRRRRGPPGRTQALLPGCQGRPKSGRLAPVEKWTIPGVGRSPGENPWSDVDKRLRAERGAERRAQRVAACAFQTPRPWRRAGRVEASVAVRTHRDRVTAPTVWALASAARPVIVRLRARGRAGAADQSSCVEGACDRGAAGGVIWGTSRTSSASSWCSCTTTVSLTPRSSSATSTGSHVASATLAVCRMRET
jgi:hypothetical protein